MGSEMCIRDRAAAATSLKMESDTPLKRSKGEIEDRVNEYN